MSDGSEVCGHQSGHLNTRQTEEIERLRALLSKAMELLGEAKSIHNAAFNAGRFDPIKGGGPKDESGVTQAQYERVVAKIERRIDALREKVGK